MFINNTIVNNFKLSSNLREKLISSAYLTDRTAFKPLHKIIFQDVKNLENEVRVAFKILQREVKRDPHTYNICHSNVVGDSELGVDEGKEGVVSVDFLHIFLSSPRNIFETTPNLFITEIFHGRGRDHYRLDEMNDNSIVLVKLIASSAIRKLYTVYLHTDSQDFKDHPFFIVNPDRYGNIELCQRNSYE